MTAALLRPVPALGEGLFYLLFSCYLLPLRAGLRAPRFTAAHVGLVNKGIKSTEVHFVPIGSPLIPSPRLPVHKRHRIDLDNAS